MLLLYQLSTPPILLPPLKMLSSSLSHGYSTAALSIPTGEHLGRFQVLVAGNDAAVNINVYHFGLEVFPVFWMNS